MLSNLLNSDSLSSLNWPHRDNLLRQLDNQAQRNSLNVQKALNSARFIETHFDDTENFIANSKKWSMQAAQNIDQALTEAWQSPRIAKLLSRTAANEPIKGLFVLGLGKLGGYDLNYSSDVDLIAFFDAKTLPVAAHEGRTFVCDKVLKAMTQALCGRTDNDRIWRVDWRLRPDPSVTGLSMSTDAALDFFRFKSAPWRRLAMMKARVVAGDIEAGENFLRELESFVWQRKLDFRTLDEIAAIKDRIKNEHPGLASSANDETACADKKAAQNEEFHVKLGAGGIREIEFTINAQQLIWGGRQAALRTTNTLEALAACEKLSHIAPQDADHLREAYIWLRRLENAIQFYADRQTHILPNDEDERALILASMKLENWDSLERELTRHRKNVSLIFRNALQDDSAQQELPDWMQSAKTFKTNDPEVEAIIETWQAGFAVQGNTPDQSSHLHRLDEQLISIATVKQSPDLAIREINQFLLGLPRGGQYLRLMAHTPSATHDIISALLGSQPCATLLQQSPHVVDLLAELRGSTKFDPPQIEHLKAISDRQIDEETRLEWIRAWTNEQLFLSYLSALRGDETSAQVSARIAQIAQIALEVCSNIVRQQTNLTSSPLSIVAFGRLGMHAMHPLSDLDLLFLANGETMDELEVANKFSLRLKSTLDAKMRAGQVWEIDTRLRPSGRSGPPTLRHVSFKTHQLERAKTWEHIALVPARFICGASEVKEFFNATRRKVITTQRSQSQLVKDAASMLSLLRTERIRQENEKGVEIKLVHGGLMEAEFLLHMLTLKHGAAHPALANASYDALPNMLEQVDASLKGLQAALAGLSAQQFKLRLLGDDKAHTLDQKAWKAERDSYRKIISKLLENEIFGPAKTAGFKLKKSSDYREETVEFIS